jgi:hypothetical protein
MQLASGAAIGEPTAAPTTVTARVDYDRKFVTIRLFPFCLTDVFPADGVMLHAYFFHDAAHRLIDFPESVQFPVDEAAGAVHIACMSRVLLTLRPINIQ